MDKQSSPKSSLFDGWNAPPNLVTYSRIVLVVIFLTLDILAGAWGENNLTMRWVAAVLFIIAASTDKIDGWMARKYNQVTEMGKLMDPIADKLLTCGAMIVCSAFGELGWWVTILFLIREIGITVMRFFVMERPGGKVIERIAYVEPVSWRIAEAVSALSIIAIVATVAVPRISR